MRIYSATSDNVSIDDFVGKDIWVWVYGEDYGDEFYARITKKVYNRLYWFNAYLPSDCISNHDGYIKDFVDEVLDGELTGYIELVKPVQTMTTEDLMLALMHDGGYLDG